MARPSRCRRVRPVYYSAHLIQRRRGSGPLSTSHSTMTASNIPFNVSEHYKVHEVIGEGAYGVVVWVYGLGLR